MNVIVNKEIARLIKVMYL